MRMAMDEFAEWQRGEPDLHELIDGCPMRLPDHRQGARRMARALFAATAAHCGDHRAAEEWLHRPQTVLGNQSPLEAASQSWRGLADVPPDPARLGAELHSL
jgi:hypothetical protein